MNSRGVSPKEKWDGVRSSSCLRGVSDHKYIIILLQSNRKL